MQLFFEGDLTEYLRAKRQEMEEEIRYLDKNVILNVNRDEFLKQIVSKYGITNFELAFDKITTTSKEKEIPAKHHPNTYRVDEGKTYKRTVFQFHIPYSGDRRLLRLRPSKWKSATVSAKVRQDEIIFEIIDFDLDAEEIKQKLDRKVETIRSFYEYAKSDIEQYNGILKDKAQKVFQRQREEIKSQIDKMSELDIPVKQEKNTPQTFDVETSDEIQIETTPLEPKPSEEPVPTLNESTYEDILSLIHQVGVKFEQNPSVYQGKSEEDLRDHFLTVLGAQVRGSATGESFNKGGKTDILLNYKGNIIFLAECKFWRGPKKHEESINQLLGNLTWRDTKSCLIYFVDRKQMNPIIGKVKKFTPNHHNYIEKIDFRKGNSWQTYKFHLPGDEDTPIFLTVLMFHFSQASHQGY